jgi:hypothetical protein
VVEENVVLHWRIRSFVPVINPHFGPLIPLGISENIQMLNTDKIICNDLPNVIVRSLSLSLSLTNQHSRSTTKVEKENVIVVQISSYIQTRKGRGAKQTSYRKGEGKYY